MTFVFLLCSRCCLVVMLATLSAVCSASSSADAIVSAMVFPPSGHAIADCVSVT